MTVKTIAAIALLCALAQEDCPTVEFSFPLGDSADSSIDARILGEWRCTVPDSTEPFDLTMLDFDGRQYYMEVDAEGEEPDRLRAYSSTLQGVTILNVAELGEGPQESWQYCRASFPGEDSMELRFVRADRFEAVQESQEGVRERLRANLENAAFYEDYYFACVRPGCGIPGAAEQTAGVPQLPLSEAPPRE